MTTAYIEKGLVMFSILQIVLDRKLALNDRKIVINQLLILKKTVPLV